jgi:hypothetical protein
MFVVGTLRALIANVRWWEAGMGTLALGAVVAALAYGCGAPRGGGGASVKRR